MVRSGFVRAAQTNRPASSMGAMRRLPLMSKLILVAGVVWATTLPIAAAFAEDVSVLDDGSPALLRTAVDALAPDVVPSPPGPQNVPARVTSRNAPSAKVFQP